MSELLDCGHPSAGRGSVGGTVRYEDEHGVKRTCCLDCAEKREREAFTNPNTTQYFAYLAERSKDATLDEWPTDYRITTFTGARLGDVVYCTRARVGFAGHSGRRPERWFLTVVGPDGRVWKGQGPGPGMYVRLKLKSPHARDTPAKRAQWAKQFDTRLQQLKSS